MTVHTQCPIFQCIQCNESTKKGFKDSLPCFIFLYSHRFIRALLLWGRLIRPSFICIVAPPLSFFHWSIRQTTNFISNSWNIPVFLVPVVERGDENKGPVYTYAFMQVNVQFSFLIQLASTRRLWKRFCKRILLKTLLKVKTFVNDNGCSFVCTL